MQDIHEEAALTKAEIYCAEVVKEATKNMKPLDRKCIYERTAILLQMHKEEIRHMFMNSKAQLKQWVLQFSGAANLKAFQHMQQLGLTGDILKDMEIMEQKGVTAK